MAIDLKALSLKELQVLIAGANAQMQEAHATQIRIIREKVDGLLKSAGLTLGEVYPTRGGKSAAGKKGAKITVAPKYRNPDNATQTWSGRGKRPLWLSGALKKRGVVLESFLIEGAPKGAATKKTTGKKATAKNSAKK